MPLNARDSRLLLAVDRRHDLLRGIVEIVR
jgi:hypothetical protein